MDEEEAVSCLRRRDPAGLSVLVRLYQIQGLRLAYTILGNRADADDAVADAFIDAYDGIHQLRDSHSFAAWFMQIVTNRSLGLLRRSHKTIRLVALLRRHRVAEQAIDPQLLAEQIEMSRTIWSAVGELAPNERVVLVLKYGLDLDEKSIADAIDCPLGTVKTRLRRAKLKLQSRLRPHFEAAIAAGA